MGIGVLFIYVVVDVLCVGIIVWVLLQYWLQNMGVYVLYFLCQYLDVKISIWVDWMYEIVDKILQEDYQVLECLGSLCEEMQGLVVCGGMLV